MRTALIVVGLTVGLLVAVVAASPWLAEPALRAALWLAGEDRIAFEDVQVDWGRFEINHMALGTGEQELAALRVDFGWPELLEGRLDRIEITGLTLRGAWRDGRLQLAGIEPPAETSDEGTLALPDVAEVVVRDARIELQTELGMVRLPLSAHAQQVDQQITFTASIDGAGLEGSEGSLQADMEVEGAAPRGAPLRLDAVRASGIVELAADGASVGRAQDLDGVAAFGFDLVDGQLQIESSDLAATFAGLTGAGDIERFVPPPWRIAVGENGSLGLHADLIARTAVLDGPLALSSGGPRAEIDLDLALSAESLSLGPSSANVRVLDAAWEGTSVADLRIALTAQGAMEAAEGSVDLAIEGGASTLADLTLDGVTLHQRLTWTYAAEALTVLAEGAGTLEIASLAGPDLEAGSLRLRLEPGERPLLELSLAQGIRPWQQNAAVVIEHAAAHLPTVPLDLESDAGSVALSLSGNGQGLTDAEAVLSGGQLVLPQHRLVLEGIAASVGLTAEGLVPQQPIPITVERLRQGDKPAWFAPLWLQATLVPGAESIAFEADLSRIGGGLTAAVRGEHQPSGSGRASVELMPVRFGESLQPRDLAPIVGELASEVVGEVAANAHLTWGEAGVAGDAEVLVDQVGVSVGPARLEQINGVITLDRLWPPGTPAGQQLAIGLLDLGLPLTRGLVTFQLLPGPRLDVSQLAWRLAGGTARAEPFSLGSALDGINVTLRAEQLDLGTLLARTKLDGLTGEGVLDGVLPVRLADGAAIIDGGELAARGPGVLRYVSDAAPAALQAGGEGVGLLLQALENFHYEELRITLDGRTDAEMDIGLHLGGANPDLYDGHPIEFNLDLEGELGNVLRQGVASFQIPDRITERMQGFGR